MSTSDLESTTNGAKWFRRLAWIALIAAPVLQLLRGGWDVSYVVWLVLGVPAFLFLASRSKRFERRELERTAARPL